MKRMDDLFGRLEGLLIRVTFAWRRWRVGLPVWRRR